MRRRQKTTGLLAAGVAHEIRNLLAQIQMAAGGLESFVDQVSGKDREAAEFALQTVTEAVSTADRIVKNLMQLSEAQQLKLVASDLNRAIRFGIDMISADVVNAEAKLESVLSPDLPEVLLNEDEFLKAFLSVSSNALQAMRIAKCEPRILTVRTDVETIKGIGSKEGGRSGNRLRDGDHMVVVGIEDTGPGFSKKEIESAFDAFYTTKATGAGTGLGLTVARKIIELHNGDIRIENREDVESGARVSIYLRTAAAFRTSV